MNGPVIIYGPQACGKTRNASSLAKRYGKTQILDEGKIDLDWNKPFPGNALILTNDLSLATRHFEKFGTTLIHYQAQ